MPLSILLLPYLILISEAPLILSFFFDPGLDLCLLFHHTFFSSFSVFQFFDSLSIEHRDLVVGLVSSRGSCRWLPQPGIAAESVISAASLFCNH